MFYILRTLINSLYDAKRSDVIDALYEIISQESTRKESITSPKSIDATDSGEKSETKQKGTGKCNDY